MRRLSYLVESNSILLSFDAERAANDTETLNKLKSMLDSLSERIAILEKTSHFLVCYNKQTNLNLNQSQLQ